MQGFCDINEIEYETKNIDRINFFINNEYAKRLDSF